MKQERVMLLFTAETYSKPITYCLIHDFHLRINILRAEITPGEEGHLLMDLEGQEDNITRAFKFLDEEHIGIVPVQGQIVVDKDRCIHCGACTAVCFSQAMVMNRQTWQIDFSPNKCVICGLCVSACPLRLISGGSFKLPNGNGRD